MKKFNEFFLEALMKNAETMERESRIVPSDDKCGFDVLADKSVQSDS